NNYKNIVGRQEVNVQGNYRLFATEFINFLSSIISLRIKHLIEKKKLNEKYTQHQVMRLLSKCAKRRSTKNSDKWVDCARLKYIGDLCEILGV
ncbi:MAG: IS1634 family transposase, partial [Firmicutes bacterium]|nr:IS1634 family transposase [Bacillota bacterium]